MSILKFCWVYEHITIGVTQPVLLFSEINNNFLGYFDPETFFFKLMRINNFRYLTDISVIKEALDLTDTSASTKC